MLTNLNDILKKAQKGSYAVGAFNINNFEFADAILQAAQEEQSPVILSTSEGAIKYAGMDVLGGLVHTLLKRYDTPVVFHLDHGKNVDLVKKAITSGFYTSVMYDGSALPYAENLANTKMLTRLAHWYGVNLEAEIGALAGIEDFVSVTDQDAHLTDPNQAAEFALKTGCDALAIAIGTSHGAFKFTGDSKLDFARLEKIAHLVKVPLVLHGASGVPEHIKQICLDYGCKIAEARGVSDENITSAIKRGICKVNIDTDLRIAFDAGIRKYLQENPEVIDPREILKPGMDLMKRVAQQKMRLFGSSHKA